MDMLKKVPVREQDPKVRATNFEEVCYGYNKEEAMMEAQRCFGCKNAKCIEGCPVSIDIPAFIGRVKVGEIEEAYKILSRYTSLPATCGRVCPQENQCEGKCIRGIKGEAVSIGKLERFVADAAAKFHYRQQDPAPANGHKIAIVGSGPAGLACAGELARMGCDVTIFEALHEPGGVLRYGIPEFRLPKKRIVAREIDNVTDLGVKIETNVVIGKAVVGGGNVAMDAARTALRLGAEVHIVYRRSEAELPARVEEVHHAKEEGIIFDLLTNPVKIHEDENGWVSGLECVRMELGEPDESGRRRPQVIPGSNFVLDVDTVIMSLGTSPNPLISSTTEGLEVNKWKCIVADEQNGKTTKEGVYAGGDAVTGAATVILAMGAGKHAAHAIYEYVTNK